MKRSNKLRVTFSLIVMVSALASIAYATIQGASKSTPCLEPYTPTKLEWLQVYLDANYGSQWNPNIPWSMSFKIAEPDTIIIQMSHERHADPKTISMVLMKVRTFIKKLAKQMKIDKHLKIRQHTKIIQSSTRVVPIQKP